MGCGSATPQKIIKNDQLGQRVDTNNEWIQSRTGIGERRVIGDNESLIDLATDAEANIYIIGKVGGVIDLDPGPGEELIGNDQIGLGYTTFVAKYSPDGDFLWSWSYINTFVNYHIFNGTLLTSCAVNPVDGSIVVSGKYDSFFPGTDLYPNGPGGELPSNGTAQLPLEYSPFIMSISSEGEFNWSRVFDPGSALSSVWDIICDEEGGVIVAGISFYPFDVNGQTIGEAGSQEYFLLRLDGADDIEILHKFSPLNENILPLDIGTLITLNYYLNWANKRSDRFVSLFKNGDDLWLSLTSEEGFSVDGQYVEKTSTLERSRFLLKIEPGASDLDLFEIPTCRGNQGANIVGNNEDMFVMTGTLQETRDFDWSSGGERILEVDSASVYILGVSTAGEFLFADQFDCTSNDRIMDIEYVGEDRYLFSAFTDDTHNLAFNTDTTILYQMDYMNGLEFQLVFEEINAVCKDTVEVEINASGLISLEAEMLDAGSVSIAEGDLILSIDIDEFDCEMLQEIQIVTLSVENPLAGLYDSCKSYILPLDVDPPTALCQNLTLEIDADGIIEISTGDIDAGSYDNCLIDSLSLSQYDFDCSDLGSNTLSLSVSDMAGLSSSCEAVVTIVDELPPNIQCANIEVYLDANGAIEEEELMEQIEINENCSIQSQDLVVDWAYCSSDMYGEIVVADQSGNLSTCALDIEVIDTIKPTVLCVDLSYTLDNDDDQFVLTEEAIIESVEDNCSITDLSISSTSFGLNDIGLNTIVVEVTDQFGNSSSCTAQLDLSVRVSGEDLLYMPNVFSPNNDGINDQLAPFCSKKVERIEQFTILDRWGNIHYEEKDFEPVNSGLGWTGTFAGQPSPKGVYFYQLRVLAVDGLHYEFIGTVNLL